MRRSLTSPLLRECTKLFNQCSQFNGDQALSAMFVTSELAPFAFELPSNASSKADRISRCVAYLLDQTRNNQSVLIPFITQLQESYAEGNDLRTQLGNLLRSVTDELNKPINLEPQPIDPPKPTLPTPDAQTLRKYLEKHLGSAELELLVFELSKTLKELKLMDADGNLDVGNVLVGSSKTTKIINLIQYTERRGWYDALVSEVRKTDPARQFSI